MNTSQKYYDLMCRVHETAVGLIPRLSFDKKHPWHLHLVGLYCTMTELLRSACILLRLDAGTVVPILLRSLLEAQVDFLNLAEDRGYGYHMRATWLKEWIKLLKEAGSKPNPFLKGFAQLANRQIMLSEWESELKKLTDQGYNPLKHWEKFERAHLQDAYASLYNFLCCETHNDIRALTSRHVQIAADGTDFQVQLYTPVDLDDFIADMDAFCGIAIKVTEVIHRVLESAETEAITRLNLDLQDLRNQIQTEPPPA